MAEKPVAPRPGEGQAEATGNPRLKENRGQTEAGRRRKPGSRGKLDFATIGVLPSLFSAFWWLVAGRASSATYAVYRRHDRAGSPSGGHDHHLATSVRRRQKIASNLLDSGVPVLMSSRNPRLRHPPERTASSRWSGIDKIADLSSRSAVAGVDGTDLQDLRRMMI